MWQVVIGTLGGGLSGLSKNQAEKNVQKMVFFDEKNIKLNMFWIFYWGDSPL